MSEKHMCIGCRERKARFRYRGRVKADRDHVLCFECYRSLRDRRRAQTLADLAATPLRSPFARSSELTDAQIAHRRRMLAHFESQHGVAART